jgi:DNA-binding CsgD family transcriptional regulator/PAS domain-containing protein
MYSQRDILALIGDIYECATKPEEWDAFLVKLAQQANGTIAAMTYHDDRLAAHMISAQYGIPPEIQKLYGEYYGARDEWLRGARDVDRTGWVGTGQMLVSDEALAKSEFYNDHLRLMDGAFHLCAANIRQESEAVGIISVVRPRRSGPFSESALELLRLLLPHLRRAIELHQRFTGLMTQTAMLECALDRVACGILFVDSSGRVLFANRSAEALLRLQDGLLTANERLRASVPTESTRLMDLIRGVTLTSEGKGLLAGGSITISRQSARTPLAVTVAPVRLNLLTLTPRTAAAVIFIADREQYPAANSEILRHLYGLTAAECKLSKLLAQGRDLREAAEIRCVTVGTARSQLKSIFRKTNTHTQSQLVRLLSVLPVVSDKS